MKEIELTPEEEKALKAFCLEEMENKEKIIELMKKALVFCTRNKLLTREEEALLLAKHPRSMKIAQNATKMYLYDRFLRKIGKLPPEEE